MKKMEKYKWLLLLIFLFTLFIFAGYIHHIEVYKRNLCLGDEVNEWGTGSHTTEKPDEFNYTTEEFDQLKDSYKVQLTKELNKIQVETIHFNKDKKILEELIKKYAIEYHPASIVFYEEDQDLLKKAEWNVDIPVNQYYDFDLEQSKTFPNAHVRLDVYPIQEDREEPFNFTITLKQVRALTNYKG